MRNVRRTRAGYSSGAGGCEPPRRSRAGAAARTWRSGSSFGASRSPRPSTRARQRVDRDRGLPEGLGPLRRRCRGAGRRSPGAARRTAPRSARPASPPAGRASPASARGRARPPGAGPPGRSAPGPPAAATGGWRRAGRVRTGCSPYGVQRLLICLVWSPRQSSWEVGPRASRRSAHPAGGPTRPGTGPGSPGSERCGTTESGSSFFGRPTVTRRSFL